MRIRKRKVIFPLSDNHFNHSPLLQLHGSATGSGKQEADAILPVDPSDNPNQLIGEATNGVGLHEEAKEAKDCLVLLKKEEDQQLEGQKGGKDEMNTTDTCRKIGNLGGQLGTWVLPQSTPAQQAIGRWCEGEKSIPLKKRRGSCFEGSDKSEHVDTLDKKGVNNINAKMMMKTKMNKKCVAQNGGNDDDDYYVDQDNDKEETEKDDVSSSYSKKKRGLGGNKRGGALMEGSRCSRVNGRGWRCSQQTLVGYSLCEHHLGKGRLRTITSVRNRSLVSNNASYKTTLGTTIITTNPHPHHQTLSTSSLITSDQEKKQKGSLVSLLSIDDDDIDAQSDDDHDHDHPFTTTSKKRGKLGTVKARSLSSLLGQTSNSVVVVDENEK